MKRAIVPEAAEGRCLKRANSSLFSIATLVDDDANPADAIAGLMSAGGSRNNLLLLDGGDMKEDTAAAAYSTLKSSGLVPLDCSDDDVAPDDAVSTSCSSSGVLDEQDHSNEAAVSKSIEGRKVSIDSAATRSRHCEPSVLLNAAHTPAPASTEERKQALPKTSSEDIAIVEPSTTSAVESREHAPISKSSDHQTGLVFEAGSKHFDRYNRFHKERSVRVTSVHDYLAKAQATNDEKTIFERCHLRVHLPGYMQRLDRISKCNCHNKLDIEAEQFKSIYFTNDSVREAKAAASSLCNLVSRVARGELDNGFAVIRPPGHHAEPGLAGGYCVINNVAVAAAYAREKLGMKKVLIVDWDVHHGNGTQRCFIDNPNVLYFSAHRYHGGNFFPFLQLGGPTTVGVGAGEGYNINVGWNDKKMGDDVYCVVWEKLLMPVAQEFKPDLVLVSAGFDAARGDMGECDISPECFARLTRRLKTLANGKVVCALEGGYVRSVLCKCIESVLSSLLDANSDAQCKEELETFYKNVGDNEMLDCIDASAAKSVRETLKAHTKYWKCLKSECQANKV